MRLRRRRRRAPDARRLPLRRRALRHDPGDRPLGGAAGHLAHRRARAAGSELAAGDQPLGQVDRRPRPGRLHRAAPARTRRSIRPRLIFEVTETAAIANLEALSASPTGCAGSGCRFALDDFGSGFGSFYYLKHLPFDYIKIDGDFVRGLPGSPTDQLVVQALVTIAQGMGKETIAEFVTDQATVDPARGGRRRLRAGLPHLPARPARGRPARRAGPHHRLVAEGPPGSAQPGVRERLRRRSRAAAVTWLRSISPRSCWWRSSG